MVRTLPKRALALIAMLALPGCASLGAAMSPYSEKFSCKNSDHGQCIDPDNAYRDAVAGIAPRSRREVTNDKALLQGHKEAHGRGPSSALPAGSYADYRSTLYRELKGLIEDPVTPMLRPARTVRTLILPYADRQRPDRLYMPRYVYSIVDKPVWVVAGAPAAPVSAAPVRVLDQVRQRPDESDASPVPGPNR